MKFLSIKEAVSWGRLFLHKNRSMSRDMCQMGNMSFFSAKGRNLPVQGEYYTLFVGRQGVISHEILKQLYKVQTPVPQKGRKEPGEEAF
ncbi:hypothetical protein SY88_21675 [Clostridiales bacterium PH28_bin88]|nr:hypothetical protein SY88_21675 [Clostridiales bacterium PH28_bin88]